MKVLHLSTGLGTGGAEMMLYRLLTQLDRDRLEAHVVSLTTIGSIGEKIQQLGVPTEALGMRRSGIDPVALVRLHRIIKRERPDIVQTWMYHSDLIGGFVARVAGTPVVWGIHNSTLHPDDPSRTVGLAMRASARISSWVPDAIVSCSVLARQIHIEQGYDPTKIRLIPNGFDLNEFAPDPYARQSFRKELGVPEETPLVGIVARLDPSKDHRTFVSAAGLLHAQRPDVHFVMVGAGIELTNDRLRTWVEQAGISENAHLLGPRDDVHRIQAALDIATITSSAEAFPLVIGEAMACGTPCVVTDVGDSARMVGDTGIVVPPRDPHAVAAGWDRLLARGLDERAAIGHAARERIATHFALPKIARQYAALYEEILAGRGDQNDSRQRANQLRAVSPRSLDREIMLLVARLLLHPTMALGGSNRRRTQLPRLARLFRKMNNRGFHSSEEGCGLQSPFADPLRGHANADQVEAGPDA